MIDTVLFDMDGVLADFTGSALKFFGWKLKPNERHWDWMTKFGHEPDCSEFWGALDFSSWSKISILPDGFELFAKVRKLFPEERIGFLTTPHPKSPSCYEAKMEWIKFHFGETFSGRVFTGKDKYLIANPKMLLLDDKDENVEMWNKAGGHAILIPRAWNKRKSEMYKKNGQFNVEKIFRQVEMTIQNEKWASDHLTQS